MKKNDNITLIGMPAVGKSTIGILLAKRMTLDFCDTDIFIQTHEKMGLQQIIHRIGMKGFLKLEEKYVLSLAVKSHVIATGGSVVYSESSMNHLKKSSGSVVHLDLGAESLKERLGNIDSRGVVMTPGQDIDMLYEERHPLYMRWADFTLDCRGLSPDQILEKMTTYLCRKV
ncbi:shikimate kinase [Desulfobacterales bacterium HSG16]|nr:shikimate kinase [Desulfobacterales bacterium HSG16]